MHQIAKNRAISCGNDDHVDLREEQLIDKIHNIERLLNEESVKEGIREGDEAIAFAKEALSYFRQYQRTRFLTYLSIMWLGWIVVLFLRITGVKRRSQWISLLLLANVGFMSLLIITLIGHVGKKSL